MEVGGRQLRQSLYRGSDDVHEFPCSPCAKDRKNIAAVKHCVECDENLCSTCLSHHNKFSVMKGHQLLDTVKTPSGQRPELPSQRCNKHGGKLIDVYCPGHDKVGCSTCIAVEHRSCSGISFVPDIAKLFKGSGELQQLETTIKNIQSRFLALKHKKQENLESLKHEKDQLQKEIRSERKKINVELDKMEKELLDEVQESYLRKMNKIELDIKEVDETLASLKNDRQMMQSGQEENKSEQYVKVKLGQDRQTHSSERLEKLEKSGKTCRMWFDAYNQTFKFEKNIIGRVIDYSAVEIVGLLGEFDASTNDANCDINDICLCADGGIAMTDFDFKRIKRTNKSYAITSSLAVDDNPYGICKIDANLLAVTLMNKKKVQFITQKDPMALQNSFSVGDRCRGITYKDGLIYVCCGGSKRRTDEGVGHLEVYSKSGTQVKSYYVDLGCPSHVYAQERASEIYVTDMYGGLLVINMDDKITHIPQKDMKLSFPKGMCGINRSLMCIVGSTSDNIVLMSCDGKVHEQLLTKEDGIENAYSVCFDAKQSRLAVCTYQSKKIKVYSLNISNC